MAGAPDLDDPPFDLPVFFEDLVVHPPPAAAFGFGFGFFPPAALGIISSTLASSRSTDFCDDWTSKRTPLRNYLAWLNGFTLTD